MGRPIYPYELGDQDFSWLVTTFQETHKEYVMVDTIGAPLVLIKVDKEHPIIAEDIRPPFDPDELLEK